MNKRELGTVLAALRCWQAVKDGETPDREFLTMIETDGGKQKGLTVKEIDDFTHDLNTEGDHRAYIRTVAGLTMDDEVIEPETGEVYAISIDDAFGTLNRLIADARRTLGWGNAPPESEVAPLDEEKCRRCGASTADGEGWNGLCGNCGDKDEQAREIPASDEYNDWWEKQGGIEGEWLKNIGPHDIGALAWNASRKPPQSKQANPLWDRNDIQFPRLLAEVCAVGLSDAQVAALSESMDLETADIDELFERAQAQWNGHVAQAVVGFTPEPLGMTDTERGSYYTVCPYCKSDDFLAGSFDCEGNQVWQKIRCNLCYSQWTEVYYLHHVEKGEGQ